MAAAFVRSVGTTVTATGTTITLTVGASGAALGNVVAVGLVVTSQLNATSVTDTQGNVYKRLTPPAVGTPAAEGEIWFSKLAVALVSTNTIVATYASSVTGSMAAIEASGVELLVDNHNELGSSAATGATPPASISTALSGSMAFGLRGSTVSATEIASGFVKAIGSTATTGTSMTITVPAAGVAAGDIIVVGTTMNAGTLADPSSVTDTGSNTYTKRGSLVNGTTQKTSAWTATATTALASGDTIVVHYAVAPTKATAEATQYTGLNETLDIAAGTATGSATAPPSHTVTTTTAGDMVIAVIGNAISTIDAAESLSVPTGWVISGQVTSAGTNTAIVHEVQVAAGATANLSTGSYPDTTLSVSIIIALTPAAAPSGYTVGASKLSSVPSMDLLYSVLTGTGTKALSGTWSAATGGLTSVNVALAATGVAQTVAAPFIPSGETVYPVEAYTGAVPSAPAMGILLAVTAPPSGITVTPSVGTLSLSGVAPTVTTSANVSLAPAVASLVLAGVAPTVTASDFKTVTPTATSLTLTGVAPVIGLKLSPPIATLVLTPATSTVTVSSNQVVTPSVATLMLTSATSNVTVSNNQTATPGIATLTLTGATPTIALPKLVSPTIAALTLTGVVPSVTATANQTLTPAVATLTITGIAPAVSGGAGLTVTPGRASLILATFAPTVTTTANQTFTPATASLILTAANPTVTATNHQTVTPAAASLVLTGFAPSVVASNHRFVQPVPASLVLASFAPTVTSSGSVSLPGSVSASVGVRDSVAFSALLRETVAIAYGPSSASATSSLGGSVSATASERDKVAP